MRNLWTIPYSQTRDRNDDRDCGLNALRSAWTERRLVVRDNESSKIEIMPDNVEVGDLGGHLYGCGDDVIRTLWTWHDCKYWSPITKQVSRTNYQFLSPSQQTLGSLVYGTTSRSPFVIYLETIGYLKEKEKIKWFLLFYLCELDIMLIILVYIYLSTSVSIRYIILQ